MIDDDGILRPDSPDGHAMNVPHKKKRYKITDKTYSSRNPVYLFLCMLIRGLAVVVLSAIGLFYFRAKSTGKENYRKVKRSGAVIVCNHVHIFDAILVASLFSPAKKVWITTLQQNMDIPFIGPVERSLGAVPIPEERTKMPLFISCIDRRLRDGNLIIVMPESALWTYYRKLRPFKPTAFRFAAKNNKPILPVAVTFECRQKVKKNGKVVRKYRPVFNYLPPVYPDESLSVADNTFTMLEKTHAAMAEVVERRNKENLEKYGV